MNALTVVPGRPGSATVRDVEEPAVGEGDAGGSQAAEGGPDARARLTALEISPMWLNAWG